MNSIVTGALFWDQKDSRKRVRHKGVSSVQGYLKSLKTPEFLDNGRLLLVVSHSGAL